MANAVLSERIRQFHTESHQTYGMPRVRAELIDQGLVVNRKRLAAFIRQQGIHGISRRHSFAVTTRREARQRPVPDLVQCKFEANGHDELWVADMTYGPRLGGPYPSGHHARRV